MTEWKRFHGDNENTCKAIREVHKIRLLDYVGKEDIDLSNLITPIKNSVKNVYNEGGITLSGTTGTGKTKLLETMVQVFDAVLDRKTETLHSSKLNHSLKNKDGYLFSGLHLAEHLFIDDVGAEPVSYMEYGSEIRPFEEVINERYDNNIGTLYITTNLSVSEFQKRYGDRVLSRVIEMSGKFIKIEGINHRYEQAKTD